MSLRAMYKLNLNWFIQRQSNYAYLRTCAGLPLLCFVHVRPTLLTGNIALYHVNSIDCFQAVIFNDNGWGICNREIGIAGYLACS